MEITRHFTATTFIVYRDRVLLHLHKKLNVWLPVGGHIDRDELPEQAAQREALEETGLKVELYRPDPRLSFSDGAVHLHRPVHLLLEDINPFHQHIDFIYYAAASSSEFKPQSGETDQVRWFSREDLTSGEWRLPANAQILALEALALLDGQSGQ